MDDESFDPFQNISNSVTITPAHVNNTNLPTLLQKPSKSSPNPVTSLKSPAKSTSSPVSINKKPNPLDFIPPNPQVRTNVIFRGFFIYSKIICL